MKMAQTGIKHENIMKKLFLMVIATILLASCGKSGGKNDIDVVGRWYEYTNDSCTEVDSTAYFDFFSNQQFARRYHDAGSLEVGGYAVTDKTRNNYGDVPATHVSLKTEAGENYFIDIVKDGKNTMFVINYEIKDKEETKYYVKDTKGNFVDQK